MGKQYDFYDIVKVISDDPQHSKINGKLAVIRGKAQDENENTQEMTYAVLILEDEIVWCIHEKYLQPTGKKADPSDFETGESIKVKVDPETGEGRLSE